MKMSLRETVAEGARLQRRAHESAAPCLSLAGARRVPKGNTSGAISQAAQRSGKLRITPSSAWSKR